VKAMRDPVVLVKPQAAGLHTNIVIVTDRRMYVIEAHSRAGDTYTAQMAWTYPVSHENAPRGRAGRAQFRLSHPHAAWDARPVWVPLRVFDDGAKTWIDFPADAAAADLTAALCHDPRRRGIGQLPGRWSALCR